MKKTPWKANLGLWAMLKPMAREMRTEPTEAEGLLWKHLRGQKLTGFRFRRQHAIERFVVDFYCAKAKLIVEVDGPVHQYRQEEDQLRQEYLETIGLRILRFPNEEVLTNTSTVLTKISYACLQLPSPPAERD